jgi:RNA polymerase sigma factor for flagellar operon FliA
VAGETDPRTLWLEYRRSRDKALRDRLIVNYSPLVKYVAGRLGSGLPAHVDEADLVSYGLLGLMSAIAYVSNLMSRSVRSRAREIERAIRELEGQLGRAPSDDEIAGKVGISPEELEESLVDISRTSIAALDELWTTSGEGDQVSLLDTLEDPESIKPADALDETEMREALAEAISRLPEREKLVVTLYYYEELTLREIGEVLGVTESRVSQLHTKAILRLRSRLHGATLPA